MGVFFLGRKPSHNPLNGCSGACKLILLTETGTKPSILSKQVRLPKNRLAAQQPRFPAAAEAALTLLELRIFDLATFRMETREKSRDEPEAL